MFSELHLNMAKQIRDESLVMQDLITEHLIEKIKPIILEEPCLKNQSPIKTDVLTMIVDC